MNNMETLLFSNMKAIKKEKELLEKKLNVKIKISSGKLTITGEPIDEYDASQVLEAIDFGFPIDTALELKAPDILLRKLNIKSSTRRKNLHDVRARVIGTERKTLDALENLSDCKIKLKENVIAIIGPAESIEYIITAITNLIRGSKQANVYRYLEKINTLKKEQVNDLGIKVKQKNKK